MRNECLSPASSWYLLHQPQWTDWLHGLEKVLGRETRLAGGPTQTQDSQGPGTGAINLSGRPGAQTAREACAEPPVDTLQTGQPFLALPQGQQLQADQQNLGRAGRATQDAGLRKRRKHS